jgi:choline dehydrogenase
LISLASAVYGAKNCTSTYDYIVVGSGPGGGPLAVTLAKNGYKVLLVEAGEENSGIEVTTPVLHSISVENPNMRWDFQAQLFPANTGKRQDVLYPRATALGGCAAHNAMINHLPHSSDFDDIAATFGDSSWTDANMRKYYTNIENTSGTNLDTSKHGTTGWYYMELWDSLYTSVKPRLDNALNALIKAPSFFLPQTPNNDLNADNNNMQEGYHYVPQNVANGQRAGLVKYLIESRDKVPNLKIATLTFATKIIFEGTTAIGIEALEGEAVYQMDPKYFLGRGKKVKFYANKEVIISGGSFNTPQLLMLSGVGNKTTLEKIGITPIIDLPGVGQNMMDRNEIGVVSKMKQDFNSTNQCFSLLPRDVCKNEYDKTKSGIYGTNGIFIGMSKKFPASLTTPNVYIFGAPFQFQGYYHGYAVDSFFSPGQQTWIVLKGHTSNTGSVTLKSKDPSEGPILQFNYFPQGDNDPDLLAIVDAIKFIRNMNQNTTAKNFIRQELEPGTNVKTDAQIKAWIKEHAWGHHACCTI